MARAKVNRSGQPAEPIQPTLLEAVKPANRFERWVPPLVVFVLAIVVYIPSLDNGFVSWDDDHYIYDNRQLTHPRGLNDIWTNTKYSKFRKEGLKHSTHQYYPLLFTMFWVEHQIYHRLNDELLFSAAAELADELDRQKLPSALQQEFADRDIRPLPRARVAVLKAGRHWLICEKDFDNPAMGNPRKGYGVRLESGVLNVYSSDPAVFEKDRQAWDFHAVNAVLHGIAAVVMLLLLHRLGVGVWVAWVVVALFAVHPMNVASVAWATERKNILALLFHMLAMLCYLRHRRTGSWIAYFGTFLFFQGALFSKTVALTFPFVLVLTDLLIDRQWSLKRAVLRGVPFLLVTVAAFVPTLLITRLWDWKLSLVMVVLIALVGAVTVFADWQVHRRLTPRSLWRIVPTLMMCVVACSPTLLLGNRFLFSTNAEFRSTLDEGVAAKKLWNKFKSYDVVSSPEKADVSVKEPGRKWVITVIKRQGGTTTKTQRFTLELAGERLNVYQSRWHPAGVLYRFAPLLTMVVVLCLVDRAAGGRLDLGSLLRIAPLLIMSVLAADTTTYMEDRARTVPLVGPDQRICVAAAAAWFYVVKLLVPVFQLPITPLWNPDAIHPERWMPAGKPQWWIPLLGVMAAVWVLFHWRRRIAPHLVWGLGFYLVTQLPMLGFKNINIFQFAYVHEHYIYNGCMGVLLTFAILLDVLRQRLGPARKGTPVVTALVCAALLAYGIKTMTYSRVWKSAETFWLTTLEDNPGCWAGGYNLGNQYGRDAAPYRREGNREKAAEQTDKAIEYYGKAIEAKPDLFPAYKQRLRLLINKKRYAEAEEHCGQLEIHRPLLAHYFRGRMRAHAKRWAEAVRHYEKALQFPSSRDERLDVLQRLAECLMQLKQWEGAIQRLEQLLALRPGADSRYKVHMRLGSCYNQLGELDQAEAQFEKALEVRPNDRDARNYLKQLRQKKG